VLARALIYLTALVAAVGGISDGRAPARASAKSALVWAVGDGDGSSASAALSRRIARSRPNLFLYLGDVYPSGSAGDFAHSYAPTYGRLAKRTAPTPGNHDAGAGYKRYWRGVTGKAVPDWYARRAGGWQILSLNSEVAHGAGSAQVRWLKARVRGGGDCRLALWHRPFQSAGQVHGDQPDVAPLWNALRGRARLVLNGHDHDSQRLRPRDGITELVAGAGGHGLYPVNRGDSRLVFSDASHYAALRLRLRPGLARYAFVSASGRTLAHGQVRCRAS
jgi:hypothetical protein